MKKIFMMLCLFFSTIAMASCGGEVEIPSDLLNPSTTPTTTETKKPDDNDDNGDLEKTNEDIGFVIHFEKGLKRNDGKFMYNLWMWEKDKGGADYQFNGTDKFGALARYKYSDISDTLKGGTLGFIIKTNKTWEEGASKNYADDRFIVFDELEKDEYGYKHVWIMSGDGNIYTSENLTMKDIIKYFRFEYIPRTQKLLLVFETNNNKDSFVINKNGEKFISSDELTGDKNVTLDTNQKFSYKITEFPKISDEFTLELKFKESKQTLSLDCDNAGLFTTPQFEEKYGYDGNLGCIYTPMSTTFKVWSPISTEIKLRLYDNGTPKFVNRAKGDDTHEDYTMSMDEKGVWTAKVPGDLDGKYYTYVVTNNKFIEREICDPYAKSTGVNGYRGMVIDFNKTNPEGWDNVKLHEYKANELTVYETHIADLTSSNTWGGTKENAKKFKGFYEAGTTYTENGITVKTGFDHIKELGVNAVQILPFFDSANDEVNTAFNWGYNPLNYNTLDGSFASDPYDGYVRVKEFKELIKAYNEAGINIIMDVVYNHVNGLQGSNFDVLMPGYYYRYKDGKPSNGSGCGNETASERYMFKKFMIDSTEFWASEYKLGGFRFDLMGIHNISTMNALADNLHKNVNQYINIYGEPWAGGSIALNPDEISAEQVNMDKYEGYGCFNDKMRDALIKGGLSSAADKGWITNNTGKSLGDVQTIKQGMTGLVLPGGTRDVMKCVNYVTCHDNYTLYDRIKAAGIKDEDTIKKMAMLANSVVFTSQGTTFMLAGEEFLRTKNGNSNSYDASYELNALDYSLKVKNLDMFKNYQKLIALKHNKALFGLDSDAAGKLSIKSSNDGSMIYMDIIDTVNNVQYRIIHCNGTLAAGTKMNLEGYEVYLDTLNNENLSLGADTELAAYQTLIVKKSL